MNLIFKTTTTTTTTSTTTSSTMTSTTTGNTTNVTTTITNYARRHDHLLCNLCYHFNCDLTFFLVITTHKN